MGSTPIHALPFPEDGDLPDGAGQIEALARAADTTLDTAYLRSDGSSSITVPSGSWTKVAGMIQGESHGDWGITSDASGPILNRAGLYVADLMVLWAGNNVGRRLLGYVPASGTASPGPYDQGAITSNSAGVLYQRVSIPILLTTNTATRVLLAVYQDSGASLTVTTRRVDVRRVSTYP